VTRVTEILTEQHVEDMLRLGLAFRNECAPHLPYDAGWGREWLRTVIEDSDRLFTNVFIAYKGDEPVGFLIGHAQPYAFSPAICAQQELWYVLPPHRGSPCAYKLIKLFEEWARLRGAIEIFTGVALQDSRPVEKITRMLNRLGYPQVGTYHKKRTV